MPTFLMKWHTHNVPVRKLLSGNEIIICLFFLIHLPFCNSYWLTENHVMVALGRTLKCIVVLHLWQLVLHTLWIERPVLHLLVPIFFGERRHTTILEHQRLLPSFGLPFYQSRFFNRAYRAQAQQRARKFRKLEVSQMLQINEMLHQSKPCVKPLDVLYRSA